MAKVDIGRKTPGQLIDELMTVNMKLFANQDKLNEAFSHAQIAEITKESLSLNSKRNLLIIAIDKIFGYESVTHTRKTYE